MVNLPTTDTIRVGELEIVIRTRVVRPWTWIIRARGAEVACGVGHEGFVTNGWSVVEKLDRDGCTKEAGNLRAILLGLDEERKREAGALQDELILAQLRDEGNDAT